MKFAFLLLTILAVQYVLSFIQIKYYRANLDKLVNKYKKKEGYYLFSGMERRQLRPGAIALLIVDHEYTVQECQVMGGFSILTKFKEMEQYKGKHVGFVLDDVQVMSGEKKKKKLPAINQAISKASENALLSISKRNISSFG